MFSFLSFLSFRFSFSIEVWTFTPRANFDFNLPGNPGVTTTLADDLEFLGVYYHTPSILLKRKGDVKKRNNFSRGLFEIMIVNRDKVLTDGAAQFGVPDIRGSIVGFPKLTH